MRSAADNDSPPVVASRGAEVNEAAEEGLAFHRAAVSHPLAESNDNTNPQGARPRILLTDTDRRPYAARLALVLSEAGCDVSAICSAYGHPLLKTNAVGRKFTYSAFRPLHTLTRAIEETQPDLVVPCDDRGVKHLHDLHARAASGRRGDPRLASLIERSLGSPKSYGTVSCRYELLRVAQEEGLRVPRTELIRKIEDLRDLRSSLPFPWVLKADESWGGRGVRVAHTGEDAELRFNEINNPFRLQRALKRALVNRDPFWFQPWWEGHKPRIVAQTFVQGRPANCAVVCWEGNVLAGIGVVVVSTENGSTGPAAVVRVVDNREMIVCAERLARRLHLSGFFGLDFVVEDGSNDTYLIEMNPRTTPQCHLQLGLGRDMIGALWAKLATQPVPKAHSVTSKDVIAYFPQAWHSKSDLLESSYHDVPDGEPEFLAELLRPWPARSLLFRLTVQLQQTTEAGVRILRTIGNGRR
jgi:hypothetical protein